MKYNQRQIYTTSFLGMLASLKPAAAIQTSKRPVIDPLWVSMRTLILPETIHVINGYAFDYTKTLENLYLGAHVQK